MATLKNIVIVFFLFLTLTGCSNKEYAGLFPQEIKVNYAFQEFSWSLDGARAAVYVDGKMNIITPDGEKIGNAISMSISEFKKCQWLKKDGNWEYTLNTVGSGSQGGKEEDDLSGSQDTKPQNDRVNYSDDRVIPDGFYEEVKLNEELRIYLIYTGKYFEVMRVNLEKRDYVTIFKSNHMLFGLNYYGKNIYFVGLNPRENNYRYTLYRVFRDRVETIYMH